MVPAYNMIRSLRGTSQIQPLAPIMHFPLFDVPCRLKGDYDRSIFICSMTRLHAQL